MAVDGGAASEHDEKMIAQACAQAQQARARVATGLLGRAKDAASPGGAAGRLPDLHGEAIEGYEIVSEVHRGGQGVVYEAVQKATKRRVAIKVLYDRPGSVSAGRLRFAREVEILAQLRHPNVVTIHDSAEIAGRFFYVMDYVDGVPIDVWLAQSRTGAGPGRGARPDVAVVLRLFIKICSAVQAAHLRGVIHRDLKPSNILVDVHGEPRVVDFGLAKLAGDSAAAPAMTMTGQFVGTLPWSSPEQISGDPEQVDLRTDVYALGVLLFQMLTGRFPYPVTGPPLDTMNHIRSREPTRPSSLRRGLNRDIDTLVLKCLQKDPRRRYQTAGELGRDIERYLGGEPLEARSDSTGYVLRKYMSRYRWVITVAACFAVVVTAGLMFSLAMWRRAAAQHAESQRRFDQVRDLAHAFLFDLHDHVAPLAGSTTARRFMVDTGVKYLDELAAASGNDASLQLELASGYDRVGDVQGSNHTVGGHLGDPAGALQSYQKALAIRQRLAGQKPGEPVLQEALAASRERIGNILFSLGRWDEALEQYEQFHRWAVARHARMADDDAALQDVAVSVERMGNVMYRLMRFEEALILYREALRAHSEVAARRQPPTVMTRRAIATSHEKIGNILLLREVLDQGLAEFRTCLHERRLLAELEPLNAQARRDLCVAYGRLGDALMQQGELAESMEMQRSGLAIAEELAAADPANLQALRDLAVCCEDVADVHFASGRPAEALPFYERRLQVSAVVYEEDPLTLDSIYGLLFAYYKLGHAHAGIARALGAGEEAGGPVAAATVAAGPEQVQEHGVAIAAEQTLAPAASVSSAHLCAVSGARGRAGQLESWRCAREYFQRCHDFLSEMLELGRLGPDQRELLDEPAEQIRLCTQAIAALDPSTAGE